MISNKFILFTFITVIVVTLLLVISILPNRFSNKTNEPLPSQDTVDLNGVSLKFDEKIWSVFDFETISERNIFNSLVKQGNVTFRSENTKVTFIIQDKETISQSQVNLKWIDTNESNNRVVFKSSKIDTLSNSDIDVNIVCFDTIDEKLKCEMYGNKLISETVTNFPGKDSYLYLVPFEINGYSYTTIYITFNNYDKSFVETYTFEDEIKLIGENLT